MLAVYRNGKADVNGTEVMWRWNRSEIM